MGYLVITNIAVLWIIAWKYTENEGTQHHCLSRVISLDLRLCPSRLNKLPEMSIAPALCQTHNFGLFRSQKGREDERPFPLQRKGTLRGLNNSQKNVGLNNKLVKVLSC